MWINLWSYDYWYSSFSNNWCNIMMMSYCWCTTMWWIMCNWCIMLWNFKICWFTMYNSVETTMFVNGIMYCTFITIRFNYIIISLYYITLTWFLLTFYIAGVFIMYSIWKFIFGWMIFFFMMIISLWMFILLMVIRLMLIFNCNYTCY